ncbi:MAG: ATP-binding protein [Gammaproteobacteria bacterium]|nr:ATP-binding protein [Gammaproteobacteria bacterium]
MNSDSDSHKAMPAGQLQAERIRVLYKQIPSVLIGNLFIALLLTGFLYTYTQDDTSLYWLLVVVIVSVIRYMLLQQYNRHSRHEENVIWWGWIFAITAFISGCTWGATSILFLDTDSLVVMMFLLMTLTGITVGSSASLSIYARSYYAFAIPTILPFAYVLGSTGESVFIVLGLMLSVFLGLQLVVAKKNQNTLDESIVVRNENTGLIKQLKIKKEKAEFSSSAKTRFLAAASHDLRQPLHTMSLLLSVLEESGSSNEQSEVIYKIKKTSASLEGILESLLNISKLDAGVISVNIKPFRIQGLFDVLENEFKSIANEKHLSIHFVRSSLALNSDIQMIERILRNLISNAIRYTESGKVLVGCRRTEKTVCVSVYDSGIGIDENKNEIIFEEFQQLDNHSRDRAKGLGLGLSIVRRLTDLLDIRLMLKSTADKGSEFTIECPRAVMEMPDSKTTPLPVYEKLAGKTIVIIEDEEEIKQALNMLLSGWGCRVLELSSVQDVKENLSPFDKVDMILADFRLANHETGVDVITALHDYYKDTNIPAVIITGDTAPERIKQVKASGFHIMHKPVAGGKLRAVLNSILLSK